MANQRIIAALAQVNEIILGKEHEVRLALSCLLARGHLLIEDIPGMGKTSLSNALALTTGLLYKRAQFTSDMLPSDLLGTNIFDRNSGQFSFEEGPVFTQILLADEINRAPPKSQSALLEAMEEQQVSLGGETRVLDQPFFVIATQNPSEQAGTYPLPESQLDRFMMRISLGYPSAEAEKTLLSGKKRRDLLKMLTPVLNQDAVLALQQEVQRVNASKALIDYLYRLVSATRAHAQCHGLSPRGAEAVLDAAKAWAFIDGRSHVIPDDIQMVFPHVADHRLGPSTQGKTLHSSEILKTVTVI
jgi:MoxR-like ATPase